MEIKIKDKLLMNRRFGAIKKIETIRQMRLKKFYVKRGTDLSGLGSIPYAITQKCRSDMLEFERRRAQAVADSQRLRYSR